MVLVARNYDNLQLAQFTNRYLLRFSKQLCNIQSGLIKNSPLGKLYISTIVNGDIIFLRDCYGDSANNQNGRKAIMPLSELAFVGSHAS